MNTIIQKPHKIITKLFPENGRFPNAGKRSLVIYDQVLKLPGHNAPDFIESLTATLLQFLCRKRIRSLEKAANFPTIGNRAPFC